MRLATTCCRRPGFRRLCAVFGVFHLSQPSRRAKPSGRSRRSLDFALARLYQRRPFSPNFF
ncbi:hypothetical protein SAMCFNEI73_Ch0790 [Sinorhizobium americanum]|uniref:Uncharacterized protein n=1 Tax=Sinorhizobium americanum TaxID=194963 RepID=A0A1L3LJB6_9HYPH|nr:hypothetical protein SAMCCGM7_Ch0792 [Sinorhizobium americanum CCGM7]APG90113.1 hypothetical protein SAMCFNEI73_Ch0790 [Sinorhizobium americanum]